MKGGLFINTIVQSKKKVRRTKYNTVAIKEAADPFMVAREIGMDIQDDRDIPDYKRQKSKVSVLCPKHNDRNHGSCFLSESGCRCFVCNQTFDVFDMVMLHCNLDFREAAGIIADLCGGRERFLIDDEYGLEEQDSDDQGIIKMISRPDMELIGIYNTPIYAAKEVVNSYCERERLPGYRHTWYPGDPEKDEDDYVVIEEMVIKSPLMDLLKNNSQLYVELIQNKAWEALESYRDMQAAFLKCSRLYARELNPTIRRIEEILIEYGGSLRNPPEFITKGQ